FCGFSGAGKTTTATAFVRAGAQPAVEDLLVLRNEGGRQSAIPGAEARIRAWAKGAADSVAAGASSVSSEALREMASGPAVPLSSALFLDAARRRGTELVVRELERADGLLAIMASDFLGADSAHEWRRYFEVAAWLASNTRLAEITAPSTLEALDA